MKTDSNHIFSEFIHYVEATTEQFNGKKYPVFKCEFHGSLISVNAKTKKGYNGRLRNNPEYTKFLSDMAFIFRGEKNKAGFETITGKFDMQVHIRSDRKDAQNILKPIFDALENAEIYSNDRNINYLVMKNDNEKGAKDQYVKVIVCKAMEK
jgi:Holliday junction resolvase RusA-like endonuclease